MEDAGDHLSQTDLLITEIQRRPALWNKMCKGYKNRFVVESAWEDIAIMTKLPKEDVKTKWKSLRDVFNRELKKIPITRSGKGIKDEPEVAAGYRGKWQHFEQMCFLKHIQLPRVTEGNSTDSQEGSTSVPLPSDIDNYETTAEPAELLEQIFDESEVNLTDSATQNHQTSSLQPDVNPCAKKRKLLMTPFETKLLEMEKEKISALSGNVRDGDEGKQFFNSILPFYRQLGDIQKLEVRNEIQSVLIRKLSPTSPK